MIGADANTRELDTPAPARRFYGRWSREKPQKRTGGLSQRGTIRADLETATRASHFGRARVGEAWCLPGAWTEPCARPDHGVIRTEGSTPRSSRRCRWAHR